MNRAPRSGLLCRFMRGKCPTITQDATRNPTQQTRTAGGDVVGDDLNCRLLDKGTCESADGQ